MFNLLMWLPCHSSHFTFYFGYLVHSITVHYVLAATPITPYFQESTSYRVVQRYKNREECRCLWLNLVRNDELRVLPNDVAVAN